MENHRAWSDLPNPLLDQILDSLPLADNIRFSAVCPRWRSVQIDHRGRRRRLLSYPWLIPSDLKQDEDDQRNNEDDQRNNEDDQEDAVIVPCYSPFDRRLYHLPNLPISSPSHFCCASSSHGWILLQQRNYHKDVDPSDIEIIGRSRNSRKTMRKQIQMRRNWPPPLPNNILSFYFLNPISNLRISLPPIRLRFPSGYYAAISDSSRCTALVVTGSRELFLFRDGDPDWILLPFPHGLSISEAVSCGEKFYCNCSDSSIVVLDPHCHPTPSIQHFEMDASQMPTEPSLVILLESGGQLLLVNAIFDFGEEFEIKGFRVFKADLSNKKWEPMESLGDRMLLLARYSSVSLVADGVGGRRNCIYYSEGSIGNPFSSRDAEWSAWKVFDLGSESIMDWPLPDTLSEGDCLKIKKNARRWIVPSIARV